MFGFFDFDVVFVELLMMFGFFVVVFARLLRKEEIEVEEKEGREIERRW